MNEPILNKFTNHLKQSLKHSLELALDLKNEEITPWHLLYGLIIEKGSVAGEILKKEKISKEKITALIANYPHSATANLPQLSKQSEKILEKAATLALKKAHSYIGTEHLLYSLLESFGDDLFSGLTTTSKKSLAAIKEEIENVLLSVNRFTEMSSLMNEHPIEDAETPLSPLPSAMNFKNKNKKNSVLNYFTTDLTNPKFLKSTDPIIGRAKETQRLIQILSRRQKNNPVLLGDPGVGKTAIVEGLAQKIITGDVPDELQTKKILRLDLGLLIAGTIYRGEFENRLKQLMEEIKKDPNLIIFIDEMHTIVGAGSTSGTLDAANILKPALARGELRCIGATTFEEYKKHIENDPALDRRFQSIVVNEPSEEETIAILQGVSKNFENFHQIEITTPAITAAVKLAAKYFPEKFFPDKALDLLDEAAAAKKLSTRNQTGLKKTKELENSLQSIQEQKEEAVIKENFSLAAKLKKEEGRLVQSLIKLKNDQTNNKKTAREKLTEEDVKKIISQSFGLNLFSKTNSVNRFQELETKLKSQIIGQDDVIAKIVKTLKKAETGLHNPNRPLASFLFVGPSGVGKTALAKTLAQAYFPENSQRSNFIRVDMSEFGESFQATKLIGAPAGYIGYKESNSLTDKIKNHPYSLILLDEIDKAHPEIFNLFLQILDEGHLTDAGGKKINFKNTIIIMTANLSEDLFYSKGFGFGDKTIDDASPAANPEIQKNVMEELTKRFRADFLNRIDQILIFQSLTEQNLKTIVEKNLREIGNKISAQIVLETSPAVVSFLAKLAVQKQQGARIITKLVSEKIEEKLADFLAEQSTDFQKLNLYLDREEIKIKPK